MWQDTAAQDVSSSRWNSFGECHSTRPLWCKLGISNKPVFSSGAEDALQAEQQQIDLAQNVSSVELQQWNMLVAELATTKAQLLMDLAASKDQIVGIFEEKCIEYSLNNFQPDGSFCCKLHLCTLVF